MRPFLVVVALAVAAGSVPAQSWEPKDQFRKKLAATEKRAAAAHIVLGKFAESERLFAVARHEFFRALELDAANADVHTALGLTQVDGKWVPDPRWLVHLSNDRPPDEIQDVLGKYRAKRRISGKATASDFEELADF
ncbi:MAG: hypothetical protein K8T20_15290, partial [Planctomycetes bacterium]|nr:hypothetical protein [Planctomycetota bacterium]